MIRQLSEEGILVIHVAKWLLLATAVGLLVGMSSTGFVLLLQSIVDMGSRATWTYWLLPLGLALSAWLTSTVAPEARG